MSEKILADRYRLVEQIGCSLLRAEQLSIGWNSSRGVRGP